MPQRPERYVRVTAPEGRHTPIHEDDGVDIGGLPLFVEPGVIRRVRWSQTTRRSKNRGDLILCDMDGKQVDTVELAEQLDQLPEGRMEAKHLHAHEDAQKPDGSFEQRLVSRPLAPASVKPGDQVELRAPTPSKEA